jgi:predicted Zn-dependent protease
MLWTLGLLAGAGFAKDSKDKKDKKKDPEAIGNRDVGKGVNFYSIEKEIAMGKEMAQEVERQSKIIDDPIVSEFVNRVGQNLVRNSDARVPFTIKLLDSEEVNAFALPGGYFFVNVGLILSTQSESELAGVMAHEIAHVAARHGTKQATRGEIVNLASIPLIFMGGWAGYAVRQGLQLAIPLGFLQFSQASEREADYLGLQYLYATGYDPTSFIDFFERIQSLDKKKPGTLAKLFSSHPLTDSRIKSAQKEIQSILVAKPEYVVNTSEFNDVKHRLQMLHDHGRVYADRDPGLPKLRRKPGTGTAPVDQAGGNEEKSDSDERPTLKRKPDQ